MYAPFTEQRRNIDRFSTLYSFEGPFELLYADIADITFLIYTFSMKNKSLSSKKLKLLQKDISERRKTGNKLTIQTERETGRQRESLNKTIEKDWTKKCNVLMFSLKVRDGQGFAVDSKIKEAKRCKKRLR